MEYADFFFFGQVVQAKFKKKKERERGIYASTLFLWTVFFLLKNIEILGQLF